MGTERKKAAKKLENENTYGSLETTRFGELELNYIEQNILTLLRYSALSLSRQDLDLDNTIDTIAVLNFGQNEASSVTTAIFDILFALCSVRQTQFNFTYPICKCCRYKLTNCENHFMNVIKKLNEQSISSANVHMLMLCEGADANTLIKKFSPLTSLFGMEKNQKIHGG